MPTSSSSAGLSSQCWRWTAEGGRRRPSAWSLRWPRSMSIGWTTTRLSVLAFAAAARLAVHRGDLKQADARLTQAMRARPSCNSAMPYLGVRSRVQLAKVYSVKGDHATARHLLREIDDILQRRPALGALVDAVSELRRIAIVESPSRRGWRFAAHPGGTPTASVSPDTLHDSRDRRANVRVPQHRQHPDQLDLSEAGRLLTIRRRGTSDLDGPARRVARPLSGLLDAHPTEGHSRTSSVSYPSAKASLGAAATTHGNPTMGTTPTRTSTISGTVAPAPTAASACAP